MAGGKERGMRGGRLPSSFPPGSRADPAQGSLGRRKANQREKAVGWGDSVTLGHSCYSSLGFILLLLFTMTTASLY